MPQDQTLLHDEFKFLSIQKGTISKQALIKGRGKTDQSIGHLDNHSLTKSLEIIPITDTIIQSTKNAKHSAKLSSA